MVKKDTRDRREYFRKRSKDPKWQEYQRQWRLKNKDKVKGYAIKHEEKHKVLRKKWYEKNKASCMEKTMKWHKDHPWVVHYNSARMRCTNKKTPNYKSYGGRGIKCLLTRDETKKLWLRDNAIKMKRPSIDRINNDGHYEIKNCRFIELSDNVKKSNSERKMRLTR